MPPISSQAELVDAEVGRHADREAAVGVEPDRVLAVEREALLRGHEHRHARAVLGRVEDLARLVAARVEGRARRLEAGRALLLQVVAEDARREERRGDEVEELGSRPRVPLMPADRARCRAAAACRRRSPSRAKIADLALHVHQVQREQAIAGHQRALERVLATPGRASSSPRGRASAAGRSRSRGGWARRDRCARSACEPRLPSTLSSAMSSSTIATTGASIFGFSGSPRSATNSRFFGSVPLLQRDDQVAAVVGDAAADEVLRQLLPPVDQPVLVLRRADAVVPDLVIREAPPRAPCPWAARGSARRRSPCRPSSTRCSRSGTSATRSGRSWPVAISRTGPRPSRRRPRRGRRRGSGRRATGSSRRARPVRRPRACSGRAAACGSALSERAHVERRLLLEARSSCR